MPLDKSHKDWLDARGIDPFLAEKFGLSSVRRNGSAWIAIPYIENGRVVNHKYRNPMRKADQAMDRGAELTLLNVDCLHDDDLANQPLIIVEGEWDALACMTAGKRRVVSPPNGAPPAPSDDAALEEGKRYKWFWRCRDALAQAGRIVIAVDNDGPGQALAADLVRLLGHARCSFVTWPNGCKDANDVLRDHGPETLIQAIDAAKPYPVKGLYRLADFPDLGELDTMPIGIPALGDPLDMKGLNFRVVTEALTVITGYPGSGKTSLTLAMAANQLRDGVPVCIASFETLPRPILERRLRAALIGCPEFIIPADRIPWADAILAERLTVISQLRGEDDEMDLDFVLDRARDAVLRDDARLFILDPWNEIEHRRRPDESETEYVGRALRQLKHFMREYRVAVWIVAHPRSPGTGRGKAHVPGLLDISGSANWANKPDYGLVCVRDYDEKTPNLVTVHVSKVRMGYPGREGTVDLAYDHRISAYTDASRGTVG